MSGTPCRKCGGTERYADGHCKACANERRKANYLRLFDAANEAALAAASAKQELPAPLTTLEGLASRWWFGLRAAVEAGMLVSAWEREGFAVIVSRNRDGYRVGPIGTPLGAGERALAWLEMGGNRGDRAWHVSPPPLAGERSDVQRVVGAVNVILGGGIK